jgi:hypothetical protein
LGELTYRKPGLRALFEALSHFTELPGPIQAVLLIGAVAVLVLGGSFLWRVVKTVISAGR